MIAKRTARITGVARALQLPLTAAGRRALATGTQRVRLTLRQGAKHRSAVTSVRGNAR